MEYFQKLAIFIKQKRLKTKLTLNKFCFEYELEPATLSRYEQGIRAPKIEQLSKIAHAFGQTLGEFLIEFENKFLNDTKNS